MDYKSMIFVFLKVKENENGENEMEKIWKTGWDSNWDFRGLCSQIYAKIGHAYMKLWKM